MFNLRFPGQYYDAQTGLDYNYFRDYDPQTGRYVESDPSGLHGGLNTYGYVYGNPLLFLDYLGLDWIYSQSNGQLSYQPPKSQGGGPPEPIAKGYSGNGTGVDNSAMQNVRNVGPIPQGLWTIGPQEMHHSISATGKIVDLPNSMALTPEPGTNTFGRSGFLIHGDTSCGCQNASTGCVVLPLTVRNRIASSGDDVLRVIP